MFVLACLLGAGLAHQGHHGIEEVSKSSWKLQEAYQGRHFFDKWDFWTGPDPTAGFVQYVNQSYAVENNLIGVNHEGQIFIAADSTNVTPEGRPSIRISSKATYDGGLFILDLIHMPEGCGTWPAFWTVGPDWPSHGEIDIIEGVNAQQIVQTTLHTDQGCEMTSENPGDFTGNWVSDNGVNATNCWINAPGQGTNQGCSILGNPNSYGAPFNNLGGGAFATLWSDSVIEMWFWERSDVPTFNPPNPDAWGLPYARFPIGSDCPSSHFSQHSITFDLTFCGQWAGAVFAQQCPTDSSGSCQNFVQNNPDAFADAYWLINSLTVWQSH